MHFALTLNKQRQQYLISLGKNILMVRKDKNMSQQDVANKCSVDRSSLGKIENGKIAVHVITVAEIAKALGVEVGSLMPPHLLD